MSKPANVVALWRAMREYGCAAKITRPNGIGESILSCYVHPQIHHINEQGMKRSDLFVLPLCHIHHLGTPAMSKAQFRKDHGEEWPMYFHVVSQVWIFIPPKHQDSIKKTIDDYALGHSSHLYKQAYENGRIGVEI